MGKDTVCHVYNKYQNQTAQLIKLEFICHHIRTHMCIPAADMQAEPSLSSKP